MTDDITIARIRREVIGAGVELAGAVNLAALAGIQCDAAFTDAVNILSENLARAFAQQGFPADEMFDEIEAMAEGLVNKLVADRREELDGDVGEEDETEDDETNA